MAFLPGQSGVFPLATAAFLLFFTAPVVSIAVRPVPVYTPTHFAHASCVKRARFISLIVLLPEAKGSPIPGRVSTSRLSCSAFLKHHNSVSRQGGRRNSISELSVRQATDTE